VQPGGRATTVAVAGTRAFAGYSGGGAGGSLFRSADGGATRAEIDGAGVPTRGFWSFVAVDRGRPGTAFFARSSAGAGVWRTASGGAGTWTDVGGGLGVPPFLNGIVVDPVSHWAWGWRSGVGVSVLTEGSATWAAATAGLPGTGVSALAIDGPGARVIVATTSGAASLPTAGGPSWTAVNGGLSTTYLTSASGRRRRQRVRDDARPSRVAAPERRDDLAAARRQPAGGLRERDRGRPADGRARPSRTPRRRSSHRSPGRGRCGARRPLARPGAAPRRA
jgi:hypothetical protein